MYIYAAGSPGTYNGFGSQMTMTPEQVAQQRAWAALPQYEKDLANAPKHIAFGKKSLIELEGRLKQAIAEGHEQNIKAMTEAIANMRDNWIPMWEKKLAEAKAARARAQAQPQTPLERSLDPRPARPLWQNPIVIGGALIALAVIIKR
jgi:hypothetical protein